jgi:arsenite methyltransferase
MDAQDTYRVVQKTYGKAASNRASNTNPDGNPKSQGSYEENIATAFGYSIDELRSIPDQANLGLSCGNPLATANLKKVRAGAFRFL